MRVLFRTFGCKANQYDTERMRQELEALGARTTGEPETAHLCVVNTCTVTNQADADARRFIRRVRRENPDLAIVVAGCSSALNPQAYREMEGVVAVVQGHNPVEVARATVHGAEGVGCHPSETGSGTAPLIQLEPYRGLDGLDQEPVGGELLRRREGGTRGWLKIQDGCDRKCSFCATRLARGPSRSRPPEVIVEEARLLSEAHPELVLTGIHIGHYGRDLLEESSLSRLVSTLLERVPSIRFRLGSVEATEIDDLLLDLMETSEGRLAPHLHMPMQSGSDAVLKRMRRWHTRETYRRRALEIADRFSVLGLGADIISGFPGETPEDHEVTRSLVAELPFTYLHVFPFSPRDGTHAASLPHPVPQRVVGERARELRELAQRKGQDYRETRVGGSASVVLEGAGGWSLTEDYLRVEARGDAGTVAGDSPAIISRTLKGSEEGLYIELTSDSPG